ncbi:MAG: GtrA family protein [Firmicutes bacterium HGW-Firmicutes-13]|nr:MAG: GtrA family protein [Firmicutes bacterium HGW-Firmicutes-13]
MVKTSNFTIHTKKIFSQFIKFGLVGISNTLISTFIAFTIVFLFGKTSTIAILGNLCGFLVSVSNSFYWNNKYVFKNKTEKREPFIFFKVIISYSLSLFISSLLIYYLVDHLHVNPYIALISRLIVIVPINFLLNKYWAFKDIR